MIDRLDDVGQFLILMDVQAFDGGFQELPFLVEWDTMKRKGKALRSPGLHVAARVAMSRQVGLKP